VVGDFLELGRPLTLQRERVAASEVIQEAIAPLRLRAEQEHKSIVLDQAGDGTISLDRRRFAQVINNLVGNALDAVSENGRIAINHRYRAAGLDLEIADDGPGMDAALLERVQQPFVTTKAHGTGLGLPLARRLVEAHGGTLTLESQPGHGTTVRLFIPPEEEAHAS
jgi:signal transduction histidine kinase